MTGLETVEASKTRFRFVKTLGIGGFGEVTRVMRQGPAGFGRLVAMKRPHSQDPLAVERLLREARLGGLLRHECIVATLDVERDDVGWYIILEYVDGPTLAAVLAPFQATAPIRFEERTDGREDDVSSPRHMPLDAAFGLAAQLCAGLSHAHTALDHDGRPLHLIRFDPESSRWAEFAPLIATCARNGRGVQLYPADDDALNRWAAAQIVGLIAANSAHNRVTAPRFGTHRLATSQARSRNRFARVAV